MIHFQLPVVGRADFRDKLLFLIEIEQYPCFFEAVDELCRILISHSFGNGGSYSVGIGIEDLSVAIMGNGGNNRGDAAVE